MGHFYPNNLDKLLLNRLYAKRTTSINEVVSLAEKRREFVHAAEGAYDKKYMLQQGFESLFYVHYENHELEPILKTRKEKRAFRRWMRGEIWDDEFVSDDGESIGDLAIIDSMLWKFSKGKRAHYRKIVITHIES